MRDLPPIEIDNSISGGTIQLKAKVDDELGFDSYDSYVTVGQSVEITADHLLTNSINLTISEAEFEAVGLTLTEGEIIYVLAVITDEAGNVNNHTESPKIQYVPIDETRPDEGTITLEPYVNDNGNSIMMPGYWNIDTYKIRAILGVFTNDEDMSLIHI